MPKKCWDEKASGKAVRILSDHDPKAYERSNGGTRSTLDEPESRALSYQSQARPPPSRSTVGASVSGNSSVNKLANDERNTREAKYSSRGPDNAYVVPHRPSSKPVYDRQRSWQDSTFQSDPYRTADTSYGTLSALYDDPPLTRSYGSVQDPEQDLSLRYEQTSSSRYVERSSSCYEENPSTNREKKSSSRHSGNRTDRLDDGAEDSRVIFWCPAEGIDFDVIRGDLQSYLGPDATVERGSHLQVRFEPF